LTKLLCRLRWLTFFGLPSRDDNINRGRLHGGPYKQVPFNFGPENGSPSATNVVLLVLVVGVVVIRFSMY